jgi:hypothetical protein
MHMRRLNLKLSRTVVLLAAILFTLTWQAHAVTFTLVSAGPPTWTYNLTILPFDNCDIDTSPTTITMTGLSGVTGAGAPTSSDFTGSLDTNMRNFVPSFSSTSVTWTNTSCGTGNFGVAKHVNGFTITSTAANGSAAFATHGFQVDSHGPVVDASGSIQGPSTTAISVPVLSPMALLLTMIGLGGAGAWQARQRFADWFGNQSNQA